MTRKLDITGLRRGKLVADSLSQSLRGKTYWHCKCDCGGTHTVRTDNFMLGSVLSCPACEVTPHELNFTLHYFKRYVDATLIGYAGFAVAYQDTTRLCRTPQLVTKYAGQRKNPLAHTAVRWLVEQGYLKCDTSPAAITKWLRRHSQQVTLIEYPNQAETKAAYQQHDPALLYR